MEPSFLKKIISKAPTEPGIYIFTGGRIKLYIGKAANLKARLSSYLKTTDDRILKMLSLATDIKTVETGSEIEALITESQYVKMYKPAFNIMLRDDKQYGFVGFTRSTSSGQVEKYPKVFITHQPTKQRSSAVVSSAVENRKKSSKAGPVPTALTPTALQPDFIGPFTDIGALKTTLRHLRKIFPYCTCKKPHNNFCLNYHIGKCPGFCCLKNNNPKTLQPPSSPSYTPPRSYHSVRYENNIKAVKKILSGKKNSLLKNMEKEMIKLGKEEKFEKAIELRKKIEKIKRVFENARIIQNILYYDTSNNHNQGVLLELKKFLRQKQLPRRIEGYDVANIQGKYAVGAMVVFTLQQSSGQANYKPDKNEYRKFKIQQRSSAVGSSALGGDTGMLKEILTRRFRHSEWPMPDLIIVDGGKAQLSTALAVVNSKFKTLNSKQIQNPKSKIPNVIALTKDKKHRGNKIYIAGKKTAVPLSRLPFSVKNLLLQVDSEAHRFAIAYYRHRHQKALS